MITEDHLEELNDIIRKTKTHGWMLNDFERLFIQDWEQRLSMSGVFCVVSDKQSWVFENIYRKLSQLEPSPEYRGGDALDCRRYCIEIDLRKAFRRSSAC
jgi:hypothetical protein